MSEDTITTPKRRRWFQFRLRTLFAAFTVVALVLGLVIHYRLHLVWCFASSRQGLNDVQSLPVTSMPEVEVPEDWVTCRFGSLQVRMPPELTENRRIGTAAGGVIDLGDGQRMLLVSLPVDQSDMRDFLLADLKMPPEGQGLSQVELCLTCRQVGSDEFRWSMSPKDVRWFAWRILTGQLMRIDSKRAETLPRSDLDGVAYFSTDWAHFEWQATGSQVGGYIRFISRSDDQEVDPTWVRAVCRSLEFTGKAFAKRMSKDEVEAQFEIIAE